MLAANEFNWIVDCSRWANLNDYAEAWTDPVDQAALISFWKGLSEPMLSGTHYPAWVCTLPVPPDFLLLSDEDK